MAFRGQYEHNLDSKQRLTVPSKFRAALADGVVLVAGLDPCVWVFAPAEYDRFTERVLGGVNPLSSDGRVLHRHFHGSSFDDSLDSAGRVRLPRPLTEHAGISGACIVVGVHDHFEIWDAEKWRSYEAEEGARVSEVAERMAEQG